MTTPDTLNITLWNDVILNVTLEHEGEVLVPELIEDLAVNLISGLGRRTALEASLGPDYIIVNLPWVEGRLPGCYSLELKGSINGLAWSSVGKSLIRYTSATVAGSSTVTVSGDTYDVTMEAGYYYTDSPIASVTASIDNGVGTPSVKATYVRKVLDLDFHNLKGNGITEITTDSQEGDEAVNTVTIKTNANSEGVTLEVRNGSRGNGIASSSEVLSPDAGGVNTHTFVDTDGGEHVFHTKNGRKGDKGDQGDSAVYDPDDPDAPDFEMANTTGQSTTKSMTQKAVTDEMFFYKDIDLSSISEIGKVISGTSGTWATVVGYDSILVPVQKGATIQCLPGGSLNYAFLTSNSTSGSPSYATGWSSAITVLESDGIHTVVVPDNATYMYILTKVVGSSRMPQMLRYVSSSVKNETMAIKDWTDNLLLEDVDVIPTDKYSFFSDGTFGGSADLKHAVIPVSQGERYVVEWNATAQNSFTIVIFASSNACVYGGQIPIVDGTERMAISYLEGERIFTIPSGCKYLLIYNGGTNPVFKVKKLPVSTDTADMANLPYSRVYGKVIMSDNGTEYPVDSVWHCTDYIDIGGLPFLIYRRLVLGATYRTGMAFYDAGKHYISGQAFGYDAGTSVSYWKEETLVVPGNARYVRFSIMDGFWVKVPKKTNSNERVIRPRMSFEVLSTEGTKFGMSEAGKKVLSTTRFVKTSSEFFVKSSQDVRLRVHYYDNDFNILGYTSNNDLISLEASQETLIDITPNTDYVKLSFYHSDGFYDFEQIPEIELTGDFPEKWDIFNVRSVDGYNRVTVRVFVTDPNSCDDDTGAIQDNGEWMVDYGVIALPPKYSNTGKPTRLIIYCHGAAVNYADTVTRFNSTDLQPNYWLAEGYAVMDVEGNPFDNVNEHICIPQAMDCYVAAYKWAIEHYNLCRDGVFVGGRSMGGMNTFNLIRRESPIPVIAACPNVPAGPAGATGWGFGYNDKTRKEFCALHMGFDIPDGYVFVDRCTTEAQITAERELLSNNWDKFIKCQPLLGMITDLPSKDVILWPQEHGYTNILDLYRGLHARAKCPIKLFGCYEDEATYEYSVLMYYKMFVNSGQMVEKRMFHCSQGVSDPHRYETLDTNLRTTVTTRYGEEFANAPVVYVEMLRFWRRYEQDEL